MSSNARPPQRVTPLDFVLRAFPGCWENSAAVAGAIEFLRQAGFSGIMLMPYYGHWEPNHATDETIAERAERARSVIPLFRESGFSVGLNLHTVGFTFSPPDAHDFGFQYQMDPAGAPNRNSACPLCPEFRDYLNRLLTAFALPGVEYIFIDDDFDYMVAGSACHCPLHMEAFSEAAGRSMTREEWVEARRSPDFTPGDALSLAWMQVQTRALLDAARVVEGAAHRREPGIRLGPMGINGWICNRGIQATEQLLKVFRGAGHVPPVVRPGVAAYWDRQRWAAHGANSHTTEIYLRTLLPDDATPYIELDIGAPWTPFDHGVEHLRYVAERSLATGSRHFAWLLFPDGPGDAIPDDHPYAVMLRENRTRFDAIAELVGEKPVFEGVDCRTGHGYDIDPRHDHFFGVPAFSLARTGMAMAPTGECVTVVFGNMPWTIGHDDLDEYLSHGALVDAGAVASIQEMGRGDLIAGAGVTSWSLDGQGGLPGAMSARGSPAGVEMTDHRLNASAAGRYFSNLGGLRKQCGRLTGTFRDEDVLSWWLDSAFNRIGPAEVAVEQGDRRLVLLSFRLDFQLPSDQILVANPIRQQAIHSVCEWIARRPLPAVIKDGADVHLFCMRSQDGKRKVLTLVNNGFNRFAGLRIQVAHLPGEPSKALTVTNEHIVACNALEVARLADRWELTLPDHLCPGPMEVRVLAFETV